MTIDHDDDVVGLQRAGRAVAEARDRMVAAAQPGMSTLELDAIGRDVLAAHGARSAPQLAYDFPGTTCISVNDEIAHGIPSARRLVEGDLVNIDVSAELDGYWADTGASTTVGAASVEVARLLKAAQRARRDAVNAARAGRPLRHVGRAAQNCARAHGYTIIANLCGHGVGRFIHEPPSVPGFEDPSDRTVLWEGLVLAVEPFLSYSATHAVDSGDGWGLRTNDGSLAAQFEHTIIVTNGAPIILTG